MLFLLSPPLLRFSYFDSRAPDEVAVTQLLQPKEETDISVPLVAPAAPGRYTAYFRLAAADGKKFGQRVWVSSYYSLSLLSLVQFVISPPLSER